ncbi:MAG: hypothetical protein KatS3mg105_4401 [Gemmatales bacterium]|nr:MAG: hypothetical protein KatS3mg105_4401 [Gemmatales bacterium]
MGTEGLEQPTNFLEKSSISEPATQNTTQSQKTLEKLADTLRSLPDADRERLADLLTDDRSGGG